jgi:uncharacterized protein YprB with RNaseH-like and TPR domain
MQLDTQDFLRLTEHANTLAFVDIEATGLRGDYNSALVVSIKPFNSDPYSLVVERPGRDQKLVREAKRELERYDAWVTYYGKGYDIPFLNTRVLRWNSLPIDSRPHLDLYFSLKPKLLLARRGQGHINRFLSKKIGVDLFNKPEGKMDMAPEEWNEVISDQKAMKRMVARCESDVRGLQGMYEQTKHLVKEIKR